MNPYFVTVANLALVSLASAQTARFVGLGNLYGGVDYTLGYDISRDGAVVSGASSSFRAYYGEATIWNENDGLNPIGLPDGYSQSAGGAISPDGTHIVGQRVRGPDYTEAFLWSESRGMIGLGHMPGGGDRSLAFGVSRRGRVVVGRATSEHNGRVVSEAFRWTEQTGMQALGHLATDPDRKSSNARAVNADGSVIVGNSATNDFGHEAFRWTESGGMVGLGDLPGGAHRSAAWGVSSDGRWIVGSGESEDPFEGLARQAVRWHPDGRLEPLGFLPVNSGNGNSLATAISDDGRIVVGMSFGDQGDGVSRRGDHATIWLPGEGIRTMESVLLDYGIDVAAQGWQLERANGISGDGRTIVGTGVIRGLGTQGWVVTLPIPAPTSLAPLALAGGLALRRRR